MAAAPDRFRTSPPPAREDGGPELRELAEGQAVLLARADPVAEEANQDRVAVWSESSQGAVLAVADGVGGQAAGGRAADLAIEALAETLGRPTSNGDPLRASVLDAFELANERILERRAGAATTLAVAVIQDRTVRCFHAGDSQVLVVGQRGKIRLQTVPHSPTGYAVEAGVLAEEEAIIHDERHLISNVVGSSDMRIELAAPLGLQALDTVVLGSDGLFDNLHVDEVAAAVRCGPLLAAARALVDQCTERMLTPTSAEPSKPDDLSFVLFRLRWPPRL